MLSLPLSFNPLLYLVVFSAVFSTLLFSYMWETLISKKKIEFLKRIAISPFPLSAFLGSRVWWMCGKKNIRLFKEILRKNRVFGFEERREFQAVFFYDKMSEMRSILTCTSVWVSEMWSRFRFIVAAMMVYWILRSSLSQYVV